MNIKKTIIKKAFLPLLLLLFTGCSERKDSVDVTSESPFTVTTKTNTDVYFQQKKQNLGTINSKINEFITCNFDFTNEMETPLIIYKADVFCGCLSTEIPREPIKKGEVGIIKVTLDTKKVSGKFSKSVFIKTNSQKEDVILLRVEGSIK